MEQFTGAGPTGQSFGVDTKRVSGHLKGDAVPPGDARRPDQALGRRTREVRSLDLIDALSEIDGRTRDSNAPSVHHVDAVGDC